MTTYLQKIVSVVVPVFCNQETIEETCLQIFDIHQKNFLQYSLEIVLVDDGSSDDSYKRLLSIYDRFSERVVVVKLSRNFGQLFAILAGYGVAKGDAIITISADLQDPVYLMADMVAYWEQGNEIVVAYRQGREDDIAARLFSRVAYSIAKKANPNMPIGGFDYLLLSRKAVNLLKVFHGRHRFFQGDVLWLGLKTVFVPYLRKKRGFGKSGWSFSKKLKYFIDLILDSSYLPIRMMSAIGVITALTGCIYAIAIIYSWLVNKTPFQGWAPLMIIVLLIGGMIMTMLGVIGEYLWRIYDDVRERPMYITEKITCDENVE